MHLRHHLHYLYNGHRPNGRQRLAHNTMTLSGPLLVYCVTFVLLALGLPATVLAGVEDNEYVVEVLAVVDQPSLDDWLKQDGVDSKERVIEEINALFLEVDLCYQSFRASGINIHVRLHDIHFEEVAIFEDIQESGGVDYNKGLETFSDYVQRNGLTYADHAIFLTADNFGLYGVTWLYGICNDRLGASLAINDFNMESVLTIAHELGHNLNLDHDSGSCEREKYIMYYTGVQGSLNRWYFSPCSQEELYKTFQRLDSNSCLLKTSLQPTVSQRMGELLTPDQFCLREWGKMIHPDNDNPEDLCIMLTCWDGMWSTYDAASPDGLTCDTGKRCYMGNCI